MKLIRIFILCLLCVYAGQVQAATPTWDGWKRAFLSEDGRVIDTGNKSISHSEGQGYGALLAVEYQDLASFEKIYQWTERHLNIRGDGLYAWRYQPYLSGGDVTDKNNASDGDILMAWALLRAADMFDRPDYQSQAMVKMMAIKSHLLTTVGGRVVLRPWQQSSQGSETDIVLNLSYWIYPAFEAFYQADQDVIWQKLIASGLEFSQYGGFGTVDLPSNWLLLQADGRLMPAPDWAAEFGYDAIRVPLYLIWGGYGSAPLLAPYTKYLRSVSCLGEIPARISLKPNDLPSESESANEGLQSVWALIADVENMPISPCVATAYEQAPDYYAQTLILLSQLARSAERGMP